MIIVETYPSHQHIITNVQTFPIAIIHYILYKCSAKTVLLTAHLVPTLLFPRVLRSSILQWFCLSSCFFVSASCLSFSCCHTFVTSYFPAFSLFCMCFDFCITFMPSVFLLVMLFSFPCAIFSLFPPLPSSLSALLSQVVKCLLLVF